MNNLPFAIDTAAFQSADSFLEDPKLIIDPRADLAFERVTTAFCNEATLYYPLPDEELGSEPYLLSMWKKSAGAEKVPKLKLTDEALESIGERLLDPFCKFVEGTSQASAQWIAFQFTPRIVEQYLSRASLDPVKQIAHLSARLIENGKLVHLTKAINDLEASGILTEPRQYSPSVGLDFQSSLHLSISYLLSVYLRGPSYGWGLSQLSESPIYHNLWLRTSALKADGILTSSIDAEPTGWFPWGEILRNIFDPKNPLSVRDERHATNVLVSIREQNTELIGELNQTEFDPAPKSDSEPTASEVAVINALIKAEIAPGYKNAEVSKFLVKVLRGVASVAGESAKVAVDEISTVLPSSWIIRNIRAAETKLRLNYRRDTFWDVFQDPGIRQAVRTHIAHNNQIN